MQTLTEIVAAVVVHSSALAYSHFGVALDPPHRAEGPPPAERTVARTAVAKPAAAKLVAGAAPAPDCPTQKAQVVKAWPSATV